MSAHKNMYSPETRLFLSLHSQLSLQTTEATPESLFYLAGLKSLMETQQKRWTASKCIKMNLSQIHKCYFWLKDINNSLECLCLKELLSLARPEYTPDDGFWTLAPLKEGAQSKVVIMGGRWLLL